MADQTTADEAAIIIVSWETQMMIVQMKTTCILQIA